MITRQSEREATPAGPDVQYRQVRPIDTKLGGNVPLLGDLCLFQRFVATRKVGTGVLTIAIEEQAVKPSVQVVMVRHVPLRACRRIVLIDSALQLSQCRPYPPDRMAFVVGHQVQHQQI